MDSSKKPNALPLEYIAELAAELHQARAECCAAAARIASHRPLDEATLDECARLDEALARAHRLLRGSVDAIQARRVKRGRTGR